MLQLPPLVKNVQVECGLTINMLPNPKPQAGSNQPSCFGDSLLLTAAPGAAIYQWKGPNGFSSNLANPKILNLSTASKGTYYLTVSNSAGCSNIDSVLVDVNGRATANAGPDLTVCEGQSIPLQGSGIGASFLWSPLAGLSSANIASPLANSTDTTSYILAVSNGKCSSRDTMRVLVWKKPTANAGPDQKIMEGNAVQLKGSMSGSGVLPIWTPSYNITVSTGLTPWVAPLKDTTYILTVTSSYGCGTASDPVFVRVYKKIQIPNIFSPNGDGIHDTWHIVNLDTYPEADLNVYNRYGTPVYTSKGYAKEWDGRTTNGILPVGTYYYVINLHTDFEGRYAGWVVITR